MTSVWVVSLGVIEGDVENIAAVFTEKPTGPQVLSAVSAYQESIGMSEDRFAEDQNLDGFWSGPGVYV